MTEKDGSPSGEGEVFPDSGQPDGDPPELDAPDWSFKKEIDARIEYYPHLGFHETEIIPVIVDADKLGLLNPQELGTVIRRGRIPEIWEEPIREAVERNFELEALQRVELDMCQTRLSDTDGGYPASGSVRFFVTVSRKEGPLASTR